MSTETMQEYEIAGPGSLLARRYAEVRAATERLCEPLAEAQ